MESDDPKVETPPQPESIYLYSLAKEFNTTPWEMQKIINTWPHWDEFIEDVRYMEAYRYREAYQNAKQEVRDTMEHPIGYWDEQVMMRVNETLHEGEIDGG